MNTLGGVDKMTPFGDSSPMDLKEFLKTLSPDEREKFAERCDTSVGHLRNVSHGFRPCGESLAIAIDRESDGKVPVEVSRPDVDWAYLRASKSVPPTRRKAG